MVEVFKTNVHNPDAAKQIIKNLAKLSSRYKANFDLEDCDKILRVEASHIAPVDIDRVITIVKSANFEIEVMY